MMTMDARVIAPLTISHTKHYAGRFVAEHREIMWALQGKRCTVCGCALKLSDAKSDHCHETGMPRGVLCHGCNTFEGAYWAALKRGDDGVAVIGRYEKGRTVRPRGSLSYGHRAMVLEKRYWPVWDLWAEQAGALLTTYEQRARGKRPDALLVACVALVVMRWRGCPAFGPLLWTTVKANGQYLLACGKSVMPDGGRVQRLVMETLARAYPRAAARSEGVGAARPRSGARGTGSFSQAEQAAWKPTREAGAAL